MNQEPTLKTVSEKIDSLSVTVDKLSTTVDKLSTKVDEGFKSVNERLDTHEVFFISIKESFNHIEDRFDTLEENMASKNQVNKLVDILEDKKIITNTNSKFIKAAV